MNIFDAKLLTILGAHSRKSEILSVKALAICGEVRVSHRCVAPEPAFVWCWYNLAGNIGNYL